MATTFRNLRMIALRNNPAGFTGGMEPPSATWATEYKDAAEAARPPQTESKAPEIQPTPFKLGGE